MRFIILAVLALSAIGWAGTWTGLFCLLAAILIVLWTFNEA